MAIPKPAPTENAPDTPIPVPPGGNPANSDDPDSPKNDPKTSEEKRHYGDRD